MLNYQVQVTVREDGQALVWKNFEANDATLITDSERKAARVVLLESAIAVLNAELAKNVEMDTHVDPPETHPDGA